MEDLNKKMDTLAAKVEALSEQLKIVVSWVERRNARKVYDDNAAVKRKKDRMASFLKKWELPANEYRNGVGNCDIIGGSKMVKMVASRILNVGHSLVHLNQLVKKNDLASLVTFIVSAWNSGVYRTVFVKRYFTRWLVQPADLTDAERERDPSFSAEYTHPQSEGSLLFPRRRSEKEWSLNALEKFRTARCWKIVSDVIHPVLVELKFPRTVTEKFLVDGERTVCEKPWEPSFYQSGDVQGISSYFHRQCARLTPELLAIRKGIFNGVTTPFPHVVDALTSDWG